MHRSAPVRSLVPILLVAAALAAACSSGGASRTDGPVDGQPKVPDGLRWQGRDFVQVEVPGRPRPARLAVTRFEAERAVRVDGRKLAPGDRVRGVYEHGDPSREWIVPLSAEVRVIGPIAWVKTGPDDETYVRVDLRDGRRTETPITALEFFANSLPVPNSQEPRTGRYLARTLGMQPDQLAMIDAAGEVVRLIRDVDTVQPQVELDHAAFLARRAENPFASFERVVRPDRERGGIVETYRTLEDRPIQPLRGGGLAVRHRTEAEGVFWSVYAADGSVTIPAIRDLVPVVAPVMEDTSAARNHTRYVAFLVPLPEHEGLYWPLLDDGRLLEAEGLVGIRPLEGLVGRAESIRGWDEGLAPPWFATASLWEIGEQRLWALQAGTTNSPALADAVRDAHWTAWERTRLQGQDQLLLTDTRGNVRLHGDPTVYASRVDAVAALARAAAERELQRQREAEEARVRAEAIAAQQAADQWMVDAQRNFEIYETIARIERDGAQNAGEVQFHRAHVIDRARRKAVAERYEARRAAQRSAYVPIPETARWGSSSFSVSYGLSAYERDSQQFNYWLSSAKAWQQDFDRRWGFDKRR